jgi:hypothetical protein
MWSVRCAGAVGVCSLAAFGLRQSLQFVAGHRDAVTVGQVARGVELLQGVVFLSAIAPSRRSMDARSAAGGIVAIHHSAALPTKASSSSSPTRTRTVACTASICEPIAARPRACWALAQS